MMKTDDSVNVLVLHLFIISCIFIHKSHNTALDMILHFELVHATYRIATFDQGDGFINASVHLIASCFGSEFRRALKP